MLSEMNKAAEKCVELHTDLLINEEAAPAAWGARLNRAELSFSAVAENVALARAFITGLVAARTEPGWDVTVAILDEVRVAVSEAVSNAIIHGYGRDNTKEVSLYAELFEGALRVRVADNGVGIADIELARRPDFTTGQDHLGLGFAFMESFMDEVEVKSTLGRGTVVTLLKLLPQKSSAAEV